jgi:hypothetical protein
MAVLGTQACEATQVVTEPFLGVRYIFQTETSPRPLKIHIAEIDLSAPGIGFQVTPRSPSYPGPIINGSPGETNHQTTRSYANAVGAQIAINGAFYASSGNWANNLGLTASVGDEYSPWEAPPHNDNHFDDALHIWPNNAAMIVKMPASIPTGWETNPPIPRDELYNALTGSHRIVQNGAVVLITGGAGSPLTPQPRTAVGLTANNAKLLLMTVDGRQAGISEGVTLMELASLLISHGATNAINLDGGGSTTMVMDFYGDAFAAQVLNSPSDGSERAVGSNLAVFAYRAGDYNGDEVINHLDQGDFNGDGTVDAADYVIWRKSDGHPWGYNIWVANLGANLAGHGAFSGRSVPEPATTALVTALLLINLRRKQLIQKATVPWRADPHTN